VCVCVCMHECVCLHVCVCVFECGSRHVCYVMLAGGVRERAC
jgi:hypothetical protein